MDYILMHKDVSVAELDINERYGQIENVGSVLDIAHLPIGTVDSSGAVDADALASWWSRRSIPAGRTGLREFMDRLNLADVRFLLLKSMGLSLSDHYWVRLAGESISWSDVNYFDNGFSADVGDLLFGREVRVGSIDLSSPDNTAEGVLRKRWTVVDGKRCLIKSGGGIGGQEPVNEVAASMIAESMGLDHVRYALVQDGDIKCSVCDDFVTTSTEFVPASHIIRSVGLSCKEALYRSLVDECGRHGLDAVPFLDRMIVFDYIIGNGDRHLNNFGIIRDADTLAWISMAPLYDNGASMGYDILTEDLDGGFGLSCMPFADTFPEQMGLVTTLDWFEVGCVQRSLTEVRNLLATHMSDERAEAIIDQIEFRTDMVRDLVRG